MRNEEMLRQKISEIYKRAKAEAQPYLDALVQIEGSGSNEAFRIVYPRGTRVEKISGPEWNGIVVGHYSSSFTPDGVVIECLAPGAKGQVHVEPAKRIRQI